MHHTPLITNRRHHCYMIPFHIVSKLILNFENDWIKKHIKHKWDPISLYNCNARTSIIIVVFHLQLQVLGT